MEGGREVRETVDRGEMREAGKIIAEDNGTESKLYNRISQATDCYFSIA